SVIDFSTIGPSQARTIAHDLEGRGKSYIDAPVTGGISGAEQGDLTMMLGATDSMYETLRPLLSCMASRLVLAGPRPGNGQLMKVLNNLLSFVALAATA